MILCIILQSTYFYNHFLGIFMYYSLYFTINLYEWTSFIFVINDLMHYFLKHLFYNHFLGIAMY